VILVGIGANLPGRRGESPRVACAAAAEALRGLPGLRLAALSRWYETAPLPPAGQPMYINGVARLDGDVDPAWLLARLHATEARAGRVRGVPNAARTMDLDLIAHHGLVRDAPDPVLPHPRAHLRAFVLAPLIEVAPDWVHPRLGQTARALLAALPPQEIRRL
jgi:2-amino-4-hydroxy-6-hydroxymethyldihydropteridine diphosphokinase